MRILMFFMALTLFVPTICAQQQSNGKKVIDSYDVAPRKALENESKTVVEKPVEKNSPKTDDNKTNGKADKLDSKVEAKSDKSENNDKSATTEKSSSTARAKNKSKSTERAAVLKSPTRRGEGYYHSDTPAPAEPSAPLPPAKIYSELRTSINDSGRLNLTSDTVIVKPVVKTSSTTLVSSEPIESTGDAELDNIIQNTSKKHEVDPRLILEVIRQESGFRMRAVSNKGAQGLMQLMPATAARFGVYNVYDRAQNVEGGTRYIKFLLDTFDGNIELALAGYNAGENAVIRNSYKVPPYRETRDYVRSITARYRSKYHQVDIVKVEVPIVYHVPLTTFEAESGRVILSNNY